LRSVPVVDPKEPYYVLGLIDFMDIATYILDIAPSSKDLKNDEKKSTEEAKNILKSATAYDLTNRSGLDPCLPVSMNAKINDIITKLCLIHRVPVLNHEGSLVATLSQSSIISFIYKNWSVCEKDYNGKTITDLGLGQKKQYMGFHKMMTYYQHWF